MDETVLISENALNQFLRRASIFGNSNIGGTNISLESTLAEYAATLSNDDLVALC